MDPCMEATFRVIATVLGILALVTRKAPGIEEIKHIMTPCTIQTICRSTLWW